jgi:hypothetical protein
LGKGKAGRNKMTKLYQVPKLTSILSFEKDFNGSKTADNPKYVDMLESSLSFRRCLGQVQLGHLENLGNSVVTYASSLYNKIDGITVNGFDNTKDLEEKVKSLTGRTLTRVVEIEPNKKKYSYLFEFTGDKSNDQKIKREIEDTALHVERAYEDQLIVLARNQELIIEELEYYVSNLLDLTKITPLIDIRTAIAPTPVHYFLPRKEGVYHACLDIGDIDSELQSDLIPELKSKTFNDKTFLNFFKKRYKNFYLAYLITNPSQALGTGMIFSRGMRDSIKDLKEKYSLMDERERAERANITQEELLARINRKR